MRSNSLKHRLLQAALGSWAVLALGGQPLKGQRATPVPPNSIALVGHANPVRDVLFLPGPQRLASIDLSGKVIVWDASGKTIATLKADPIDARLANHKQLFTYLAATADGSRLFAGSLGHVRQWRTSDWTSEKSCGDPKFADEGALRLSRDGETAVTFSDAGLNELAVWETKTGKERCRIKIGEHLAQTALSPNGSLLALRHEGENAIRLFNARNGDKLPEIKVSSNYIAFTDDGSFLLCQSQANQTRGVLYWDVRRETELAALDAKLDMSLTHLIIPSADGKWIAARGSALGSRESRVRLIDVNQREIRARPTFPAVGWPVAFSRDGERMLASHQEDVGFLVVYETKSGRTLTTIKADRETAAARLSADGRLAALANNTGGLQLVPVKDEESGAERWTNLGTSAGHEQARKGAYPLGSINLSLLNDGGGAVLSVRDSDSLFLAPLNPPSPQISPRVVGRKPNGGTIDIQGRAAAWFIRPDGRGLFASFHDVKYTIDFKKGHAEVRHVPFPDYRLLKLSPKRDIIASFHYGQNRPSEVALLDTNAKPIRVLGQVRGVEQFAFSPAVKWLAALVNLRLKVWDVQTGDERLIATQRSFSQIDFLDDETVAAVDRQSDREIILIDVKSGQEKPTPPISIYDGRVGKTHGLAFLPQAAIFATVGDEGQVIIHDLKTGRARLRWKLGDEPLIAASFSPDGKRFAVLDINFNLHAFQVGELPQAMSP